MSNHRLARVGRRRGTSALLVGTVVALVCAAGLTVTHKSRHAALPPARAIAAALKDPHLRQALKGERWDRVASTPVDSQLTRVSFFERGRILAEVAVPRSGRARQVVDFRQLRVPYGSWIAYQPALLVGLAALFLLMAGVTPWRRMRNLDALAALSLLAPVILLRDRYLAATVLSAAPGMVYLMLRCAWLGLGSPRCPAPSRSLFTALTPGFDARGRVRLLRVALGAMALIFLMVGISSPNAVDVAYAVMEGATKLVHGILPYGHMPGDIIHGDTYPLLTYALYAPLALAAPVRSVWDSVDVALGAAVAAALCTAWALARRPRDAAGERPAGAQETGLRAALAWLAFPPLLVTVSTGTTDVALAAMLTMALLLWRRPALSVAMLAAAAWFKAVPAALLPVWLAPLRGRRLGRAFAAMIAVSLPMAAALLAFGGLHGPEAMLRALSYQLSRGSTMSIWAALGAERLQPIAQACVLGLIAAATWRLRREPALAGDPVRLAALSGAILIGLQLAADYWAFLYLAWLVPLLCLSVLRRESATEVQAGALALPGALVPAAAVAR